MFLNRYIPQVTWLVLLFFFTIQCSLALDMMELVEKNGGFRKIPVIELSGLAAIYALSTTLIFYMLSIRKLLPLAIIIVVVFSLDVLDLLDRLGTDNAYLTAQISLFFFAWIIMPAIILTLRWFFPAPEFISAPSRGITQGLETKNLENSRFEKP